MLNHTGRLVLTTRDPEAAPDPDLLRVVLSQAGFIGPRRTDGTDGFEVGPNLLALLSFTGCAVVLPPSSVPGSHETRCQVRILGPAAAPRLVWGRNTRGPRCPVCRTRLQDWRERLPDWPGRRPDGLTCPRCGGSHPPGAWDWKQQAGFGRLFVFVEEVFPGEAVPTQGLLDLLIRVCACGWRHCYVQD